MEDALRDRLAASADGHGAFRRIGQHFRGHLNRGSGDLADLLDFGAAFANE